MGIDHCVCSSCNNITSDFHYELCKSCTEVFCSDCIPNWRYAHDPEFICKACDEGYEEPDTVEVMRWALKKYLPDKSIEELTDEYIATLPQPPQRDTPCGQCFTTACLTMEDNDQGKANTAVEHLFLKRRGKLDYCEYRYLRGWCCRCTAQEVKCEECKSDNVFSVKRAKVEEEEDDEEEDDEGG